MGGTAGTYSLSEVQCFEYSLALLSLFLCTAQYCDFNLAATPVAVCVELLIAKEDTTLWTDYSLAGCNAEMTLNANVHYYPVRLVSSSSSNIDGSALPVCLCRRLRQD